MFGEMLRRTGQVIYEIEAHGKKAVGHGNQSPGRRGIQAEYGTLPRNGVCLLKSASIKT